MAGFGLYRVSQLRAASCEGDRKVKLTFSTGRPVLDGDKLILSVGENPVLLHARYKLLTAAGYGVMNATGGL